MSNTPLIGVFFFIVATFIGVLVFIASITPTPVRKEKRSIDKLRGGCKWIHHPIHACTKEQHLKWIQEGKCQCCGVEPGEYKSICEECRLS